MAASLAIGVWWAVAGTHPREAGRNSQTLEDALWWAQWVIHSVWRETNQYGREGEYSHDAEMAVMILFTVTGLVILSVDSLLAHGSDLDDVAPIAIAVLAVIGYRAYGSASRRATTARPMSAPTATSTAPCPDPASRPVFSASKTARNGNCRSAELRDFADGHSLVSVRS